MFQTTDQISCKYCKLLRSSPHILMISPEFIHSGIIPSASIAHRSPLQKQSWTECLDGKTPSDWEIAILAFTALLWIPGVNYGLMACWKIHQQYVFSPLKPPFGSGFCQPCLFITWRYMWISWILQNTFFDIYSDIISGIVSDNIDIIYIYIFWHSICLSGILSGIYFDIPSGIL